MSTFNPMNVSPATPQTEPMQSDTQRPTSMFASLMKEAESMPEPTAEEIAEADRIFAEAFAPYERRAEYLAEQEMRRAELREFVSPHLVDLTKPAPIIKPIIEHRGITIASLGNTSARCSPIK